MPAHEWQWPIRIGAFPRRALDNLRYVRAPPDTFGYTPRLARSQRASKLPAIIAPSKTPMNIARPHSFRRWIVIAIAVLVLIAAFVGWKSFNREPAPQLATAPAQRGDIEATVVATGALEAVQMVSVGAQVSGRVESLKVELGDVVKAGDLIAEIDPTTQQNQVNNARAAVASNRA